MDDLLAMDFISLFTFYQLTESIARNWKRINKSTTRKAGFMKIFTNKYCRDVNNFRRDMKTIREARNTIAHSKKLFTPEEIKKIYKIADLWLRALNIDIEKKVLSYRLERPKFLEPLVKK